MNRNQATIMQEEEYNLMKVFLGEYNSSLPKIKIDKYGCRELKSSMELAKIKIKTNTRTGGKTIHKNKTSEKLPLQKLPMHSTNMSDAGKYFFFRPKWVNIMRKSSQVSTGDPGVY
jgi:3-polyprenyl-4-hydroxybenzoate decarboxylase